MKLQGRGLYNLLRLNAEVDSSVQAPKWQIADYRKCSVKELFNALEKLGISLNEERLKLFAENISSPEELTHYLWDNEEDVEGEEKTYLLLFELWRRLLPDQPCISIFCDQLDELIELYDRKELSDLSSLINYLDELENILDEHVDQGSSHAEVFSAICDYCAHNIENFLYDFIFDLIQSKDDLTASELLDGFYPYVKEKCWFDLLQAEILFATSAEEATLMLRRILETQKENPDLPFYFEVLYVACQYADQRLFSEIFNELFVLIELEEELQELLQILAEFLRFQDRDEHCKQVEGLLQPRKALESSAEIKDKALLQTRLEPILSNF